MATIDTLKPAAVAAIRALYEDGVSTAEICARFAIGRKRFYALRKAHGWPPRGTHARAKARRQRMTPRLTPDMMIARIGKTMTHVITRIKTDLKNPEATDIEADISLLASLWQARVELERLRELDARDAPERATRRATETLH